MTRIIAPVFTKRARAVQVFNFHFHRDLGDLRTVLRNVNELQPDEICLLSIDGNLNSILKNNDIFYSVNLPLIAGGGVSTVSIGDYPVERFLINSAYFENKQRLIDRIKVKSGQQSLLLLLPFENNFGQISVWNSSVQGLVPLDSEDFESLFLDYSEIVLLDMKKQGLPGGFDFTVLNQFPDRFHDRIIVSGGIDSRTIELAKTLGLGGVMIDNQALYYNEKIYLRC